MLTPWKESYDQLDSILKSRDITLSTKVHLVKAMAFSVVMYGRESWQAQWPWCRGSRRRGSRALEHRLSGRGAGAPAGAAPGL